MSVDHPAHPADQAKVRCFGNKAALTAEATLLYSHGAISGHSINLDLAPRQAERILWERKITLQLSADELPLLAAVCLGYLPQAQFKRPNKGIIIERQANKLFISASQGAGNLFALPIGIGQGFLLSTLVLAQLKKLSHTEDDGLIIAALRGVSALYRRD